MKIPKLLPQAIFGHLTFGAKAQTTSYDIRLNQVGFLSNTVKVPGVISSQPDSFKVIANDIGITIFEWPCLPSAYYAPPNENVWIDDFNLLQAPDNYVIAVDDLCKSVPFSIGSNVFVNLSKASINTDKASYS